MDATATTLLSTSDDPEDRAILAGVVAAIRTGRGGPSVAELLTLSRPALYRVGSYLQAFALLVDCDEDWAACQATPPAVPDPAPYHR